MTKTITESKVGNKKYVFVEYILGSERLEWTVFASTKTLSKRAIYLAKLKINGKPYNSYGCFGHTYADSEDKKEVLLSRLEHKTAKYLETGDRVAAFGQLPPAKAGGLVPEEPGTTTISSRLGWDS